MSAKRRRTAADLLVEGLEAEGCEWVFSVPGEETMDILEALSHSQRVRHVTTVLGEWRQGYLPERSQSEVPQVAD